MTDDISMGTGSSATFQGRDSAGWSSRHASVPQRQSLKAKRGPSPGTLSPEEAESDQGSRLSEAVAACPCRPWAMGRRER